MNQWLASTFGVTVLAPLLLLTLFAMVVPIIIHLLSKSLGQRIKIAQTKLLQLPKQQPVTHLALQQRTLLFLRLLMIGLISLILAEIMMTNGPSLKSQSALVAVSESWLHAASDAQRNDLADMIADNPAVLLTPRSRRINAEQVRLWLVKADFSPRQNLWSQIGYLLAENDRIDSVKVFATNSSLEYIGSKAPINSAIKWNILPLEDQNISQHTFKIRLKADSDSVYLPYWQHALTLLQNMPSSHLTIDWAMFQPDATNDDVDWLISLPTTKDQLADEAEVTRLNQSVELPEFPLFLSQAMLQKLDLKTPNVFLLSKEQISETSRYESTLALEDRVSLRVSSPIHAYLSMLLIVLFCAERWFSEKYGKKTWTNIKGDPT